MTECAPMKVLILGASGMVGQGVLRECLLDPEVSRVVSVGRSALPANDPKLVDLIAPDLFDLSSLESQLAGLDACFFCLGVSSAGMKEAAYARITYDLTLSIAAMLAKLNPGMTFIYVSGEGTDSTETGRSMWARVKGRTENALFRLPFKAAYMFRPGFIQPLHGIRSKTKLYDVIYRFAAPLLPILKRVMPNMVTTTERVGRAMLIVAKQGAPKRILATRDINAL
jgi:uncharacterized protein YbjT (DUF2867 family)